MNKQITLGIIAVVAVIALAGVYLVFGTSGGEREYTPVSQTTTVEVAPETETATETATSTVVDPTGVPEPEKQDEPDTDAAETAAAEPAPVETPVAPAETVTIDVTAALAERSVGEASAPVVIEEFASLSCSHCATFYSQVFPKIREQYVDTGKVRFIYTDFPLNAPAMDGAMLARCLPQDRYFKFIKFLFDTQNDWAFNAEYSNKLRQAAKLVGASDALVDACLANEELKQGLIARMQEKSEQHNIQSTPSFVINGTEVITGAQEFAAFQTVIDKLLAESNGTE